MRREFTLTQAQFQRVQPAAAADADAAADWQTVALPDTWAARGLPQTGGARYRLNFVLPTAPTGRVWALRIDRLSTAYTLRVNGVLVGHQRGTGSAEGGYIVPIITIDPAYTARFSLVQSSIPIVAVPVPEASTLVLMLGGLGLLGGAAARRRRA